MPNVIAVAIGVVVAVAVWVLPVDPDTVIGCAATGAVVTLAIVVARLVRDVHDRDERLARIERLIDDERTRDDAD
jgi:hypothetical protein